MTKMHCRVWSQQVLRETGVPVSACFHIEVQQNGAFFGLFSLVEMVDEQFLQVGHLK